MELREFDRVVVNSSAGKDSQTSLRQVVLLAMQQDYPLSKIIVSHQDLGEMEWLGTKELAQKQAEIYGLRFEISRYRNKEGEELSLLQYIRRRGFWPSNKQRFCTSEFKRSPGSRVLTKVAREVREQTGKSQAKLLQIFGFRAQESSSRAKKQVLQISTRHSRGNMEVTEWLPIHAWDEEQVWRDIKESGVPWHPAYSLGMPRLSCSFCIFAPKDALLIAGRARPDLLRQYVDLEREMGHTFQNKKPIADVARRVEAGEQPDFAAMRGGKWNM